MSDTSMKNLNGKELVTLCENMFIARSEMVEIAKADNYTQETFFITLNTREVARTNLILARIFDKMTEEPDIQTKAGRLFREEDHEDPQA